MMAYTLFNYIQGKTEVNIKHMDGFTFTQCITIERICRGKSP